MRGLPVNVKALRVSCAPLHELEQAVAGTNVPAAMGRNNDGRPRPANTGINDAKKDGLRRKPRGISCQKISRCFWIADRGVCEQIDNGYAWRHLGEHCFHLTRIGTVQPEVCEEHNHDMPTPI